MTVFRVEVRLPYETGLPRDVAINTFWFQTTGVEDPVDVSAFLDGLEDFYNTTPDGATHPISYYLSAMIDRDACSFHVDSWDYTNSELDFVRDQDFTLGAASGSDSLPFEVSLCCSFSSSTPGEGTTVPANSRGRVYIGPLTVGSLSGGTDPFNRPTTALVQTIAFAARDMSARNALFTPDWVIFSKTVGGALSVVDQGWVDNEWDTQRRRGVDASSRESWSTA